MAPSGTVQGLDLSPVQLLPLRRLLLRFQIGGAVRERGRVSGSAGCSSIANSHYQPVSDRKACNIRQLQHIYHMPRLQLIDHPLADNSFKAHLRTPSFPKYAARIFDNPRVTLPLTFDWVIPITLAASS